MLHFFIYSKTNVPSYKSYRFLKKVNDDSFTVDDDSLRCVREIYYTLLSSMTKKIKSDAEKAAREIIRSVTADDIVLNTGPDARIQLTEEIDQKKGEYDKWHGQTTDEANGKKDVIVRVSMLSCIMTIICSFSIARHHTTPFLLF